VSLSAEQFVPYLGRRLSPRVDAELALAQLHADDLYLACACALADPAAIAALEAHCLDGLDAALARFHLGADGVAEVKQQIRRNLLVGDERPPEINDFVGRGDLRGWVRVMAVRLALKSVRRMRKDNAADEGLLAALQAPGDPELEYLKKLYRDELKLAVNEAILALPARERTLLRQQYIDDLTIDEIGSIYRVHRATAARWVARARESLLKRVRSLLMKRLMVGPAELDSVLRLINSRLDMSIRAFFRQRRG
jgi:RNA polymerase sigma-70 factor (ECF subfamily)